MDDLGIVTTRLFFAVQKHLFEQLTARGHPEVRPRHGAVLAHLGEGAKATDLALRSGRNKQAMTRLIDELEHLGYVERQLDPQDRRVKSVVPTERGRSEVHTAREILVALDANYAHALGDERYSTLRTLLGQLLDHIDTIPADRREDHP